ncbi:VPLPA-CTERM sorting domain-containing protein [Pacificoceanicola onchidii]|uniref:VPLPA-CTERM sorting domain-containing protein n=1 Tax=Pacificoceanicola onchidii TaxID=2562685 RepID=UPI001455F32F|nr:VPLPA-CTERM sorting domain-containing protein [Pacificoceanicola onchidii]
MKINNLSGGVFSKILGLCSAAALTVGILTTQANAAIVIYSEEVNSDVVFSYSGTLDLSGLSGGGPAAYVGTFAGLGAHEPYFGNLSDTIVVFYDSPYSGTTGSVYNGVNSGYNFNSIGHTGDPFFFRNSNLAVASGYGGELISGGFTMVGSSFASLSLVAGSSMTKTLLNGDTITWNISAAPSTMSAVPLPAALPLLVCAIGGLGLAARRRKKA